MKEIKIFTSFHKKTKRNYLERMNNEKIFSMNVARKYGKDYWDGKRRYGYGGYSYIPNLLEPIAIKIIKNFNLSNNSKILDVGCGKGFLLYEIKRQLPKITVKGFDISAYAIKNAKEEVKKKLFVHKAQDKYPFKNKYFDLVISFNCLHNLKIYEIKEAVSEINRVAKKSFIVVESYKNTKQLFNLQCWALTANAFFEHSEWLWILKNFNYDGFYEFIYFD
jgi:SAM-dependent methyltransferase